jgi:2Fe-2S ferredoxin
VVEGEAEAGTRLLALAQRCGLPLEGTCGGAMACATCHLIVDAADAPRLPLPTAEEEDMLDLVADATRTSRLSCQIVLTPALDGIAVRLP